MRTIAASLSLALIFLTLPAVAHHGFDREFDPNQPVLIQGTITKVEWENPHVTFVLNARGPDGRAYNWTIEMAGKSDLKRVGWRKDSLKIGEQVTVNGFAARDGTVYANAKMVTLSDGRTMDAVSF